MHTSPALSSWNRLTNRRGAVLLLTIYLVSLVMLFLGGIALQRTMTESRAAQVSRNTQQAFYLAEGTLDFAMRQLAIKDLPDGSYPRNEVPTPGMLPRTSFTITTSGARVVDRNTQVITRTIAATGTAPLGASSTITATVTSQGPVRGAWSTGPIRVVGALGNGGGAAELIGDLRSGLGITESIKLQSTVNHQGQLQIAPAGEAPAGQDYHISNFEQIPWLTPLGSPSTPEWATVKPGVYLQQAYGGSLPTSKPCAECPETEAPAIFSMPEPPMITPLPADKCTGTIDLAANENVTIVDGNVNPRDLSPAGDGRIVLCLQYLVNHEAHSKVIFTAPATVYLAGKNEQGYAVRTCNLYAVPPSDVSPHNTPLMPSGLKLIVTKAPTGQTAGKISLESQRFAGSVYAPESEVCFETEWASSDVRDYRLEHIVAREITLLSLGRTLTINNKPANASAARTTVTLKSWSSQ